MTSSNVLLVCVNSGNVDETAFSVQFTQAILSVLSDNGGLDQLPALNFTESAQPRQFVAQTEQLHCQIVSNPTYQDFFNALVENTRPSSKLSVAFLGAVSEQNDWILQDAFVTANGLKKKLNEFRKTLDDNEAAEKVKLFLPEAQVKATVWSRTAEEQDSPFVVKPIASVDGDHSEEQDLPALSVQVFASMQSVSVEERLPSSDTNGAVKFSRPTIYIFPEGDGASAFFGIPGYSMLIDAGFSDSPAFWGILRFCHGLDSVLLTNYCANNVQGITAFLQRCLAARKLGVDENGQTRAANDPVLRHCRFGLLHPPGPSGKAALHSASEHGGHQNVAEWMNWLLRDVVAKQLNLHTKELTAGKPTAAPRCVELYRDWARGILELYPLNPLEEEAELKKFLSEWGKEVAHFSPSTVGKQHVPLLHSMSLCALLVWKPADANEPISRLLFPGMCPQSRLIQSLNAVHSHLGFLKTRIAKQHVAAPAPTSAAAARVTSNNTTLKKPSPSDSKRGSIGSITGVAKPSSASTAASTATGKVTATKSATTKATPTASTVGKKPASAAPTPSVASPRSTTVKSATSTVTKHSITAPASSSSSAGKGKPSATKLDSKGAKPAAPRASTTTGAKTKVAAAPAVAAATPVVPEPTSLVSPATEADVHTDLISVDDSEVVVQSPVNGHSSDHEHSDVPEEEHEHEVDVNEVSLSVHEDTHLTENMSSPDNEDSHELKDNVETDELEQTSGAAEEHVVDEDYSDEDDMEEELPVVVQKVDSFDPVKSWGEPQNLPMPPPPISADGKPSSAASRLSQKPAATKATPAANPIGRASTNTSVSSKSSTAAAASNDFKKPLPAAAQANSNKTNAADNSRASTARSTASTSKPKPAANAQQQQASSAGGKSTATAGKDNALRKPITAPIPEPGSSVASNFGSKAVPYDKNLIHYVDCAYIPAGGSPNFVDVEFFKRVRSRYYILSSVEPPTETLDALLLAKETWDKSTPENERYEVFLVPTHESDNLLTWIQNNMDRLRAARVEVEPSASLSQIQLEDASTGQTISSVARAYRIAL